MVKLVTVPDMRQIIRTLGMDEFFRQLVDALCDDFKSWETFQKISRHAVHMSEGVMELMPILGEDYYAFKYVNGHPHNPLQKKQTVVAIGMLADAVTGYPLLISEMTLLTAIRTAAVSALAARYLAKKNSQTLGIVGTGAQSEFQVLAHQVELGITQVKYFDVDADAMKKFAHNLQDSEIELQACKNEKEAITDVDVIITATAKKKHTHILKDSWINKGVHINGLGGDCPGKTELDPKILKRAKIVVEYLEQTKLEGEIQHIGPGHVYAELWELVMNNKTGRENDNEITLFDSVGFALEDYAVLKYIYQITSRLELGQDVEMIPEIDNPKDLYGSLQK